MFDAVDLPVNFDSPSNVDQMYALEPLPEFPDDPYADIFNMPIAMFMPNHHHHHHHSYPQDQPNHMPIPALPPPPQPPQPPAQPNKVPTAWVEEMRPRDFLSESEFMYMHGHADPLAARLRLPDETVSTAAGQHRPPGTVMFMNQLPESLRQCPCHCSIRNPSGDMSVTQQLREFVRLGYLQNGEPLQLMLPGADTVGDRWRAPLAVVGEFRIRSDGTFEFVDAACDESHCCPTAWAYATFVMLCAENYIPDTEATARQMRAQLQLRSHAMRLVRVQALGATLWQIGTSYRHDMGMAVAAANASPEPGGKPAGRSKLQFKAPSSTIRFRTRDELRDLFAPCNAAVRFNETNMWMHAQTRRIRHCMQVIEGLQATVDRLRRAQ
jgi:hypothetical protein